MNEDVRIVTVDASNVEKERFFCYKSKPKSAGYQQKLAWLQDRFAEGMVIKILYEGKRSFGFVEYLPGEYAWRAVKAPDYLFIHCLWVVGKGKGKGFGSRLLGECLDDARRLGKQGVAMVSSSRVWLADKDIFLKNGFQPVDQAPPSFDLLAYKFNGAPDPAFPDDWQARAEYFGEGLTVVRSNQCPYIEDAAQLIVDAAAERGIETKIVKLRNSEEVQALSPTPYGVFGVVYGGQTLSYHYLLKKDLDLLLDQAMDGTT